MNPTPNDMNKTPDDESFGPVTNVHNVLEGEISKTSVLPLAIACLSTGLFLGSFFTKKAPVSLVISSV